MATTYTDTTVNSLVINKMTKAEYDALQNKSDTELYLVPDEIDNAPTSGSDNPVKSGGVYSALADKISKSSTSGLVKNDGTIDTSTYLTSAPVTSVNGQTGAVVLSIPDISGKEDKVAIDATAKTASFTASVGNYYKVNIAASGSVTITLTTPSDSTKLSSCIFFVTTSTSPALTFSSQNSADIYKSTSYSIEASKVYEVNAMWNGSAWCIASVELEVQS